MAVGPGARGEDGKILAMGLKKGNRVLLGKTVRDRSQKSMVGAPHIMKESDIMGTR